MKQNNDFQTARREACDTSKKQNFKRQHTALAAWHATP
jgi:hypothetical protein